MKKIIKGKLYDTDTARLLGYDGGGDGFGHWSEELYQKRTGEYFLYGEGGPMTRYAVAVDANSWSGGDRIMPLTADAAREWAEEHLSADKYAEIFGMPDEDAEDADLHIQIPAAINAQIRAQAAENGESLTAYIVRVLRAQIDK